MRKRVKKDFQRRKTLWERGEMGEKEGKEGEHITESI